MPKDTATSKPPLPQEPQEEPMEPRRNDGHCGVLIMLCILWSMPHIDDSGSLDVVGTAPCTGMATLPTHRAMKSRLALIIVISTREVGPSWDGRGVAINRKRPRHFSLAAWPPPSHVRTQCSFPAAAPACQLARSPGLVVVENRPQVEYLPREANVHEARGRKVGWFLGLALCSRPATQAQPRKKQLPLSRPPS